MYSEMLTFFPLNLYNIAELHDVLTASPHWPSPTVIKYTKMDFQCLLDALSSVRKTIIIIKVSKTFSHFLIRFKNLHMSTWQNNQKIIQPRAQSNQKKKEKKRKKRYLCNFSEKDSLNHSLFHTTRGSLNCYEVLLRSLKYAHFRV